MHANTRSYLVGLAALLLVSSCSGPLSFDVSWEGEKPSGLINLNPDPNGEPWFAGGMPLPDESSRAIIDAASVYTPKVVLDTLPSRVDNSVHRFFRPIFNQGDGSCSQASGVGYTYTYEINRKRGLSASLPENQYPTHFTYNYLNYGSGN